MKLLPSLPMKNVKKNKILAAELIDKSISAESLQNNYQEK